MRRDTFLKSLAALAAAGALPVSAQTASAIKMMIPANPGGGWDTTGRALGKAMQDAGVASSVTYDNKGGAAGAIGLAQFVNSSKGDPHAMMVMEGGKLVGVFSERDYTRKIALAGRSSKDTLVADIMTAQVLTVSPKSSTRDCMELMSAKSIRHLPVVDGDKVIGMISIRDIMDDIIADHELTISQLQHYISS